MTVKGNGLSPPSDSLAGTEEEKAHSEKLKKYAEAKGHSKGLVNYILQHKAQFFKLADALASCGDFLIFRHFFQVHQYRMIGGCTCKKHLLCALCAMRRSAKLAKQITEKVKFALGESPENIAVLITLTIKNGSSLKERYNHLSRSLSRILHKRRNQLNGSRTSTIFAMLRGAAGSFEVKRGSGSGEWHIHLHMIALVDRKIDLPWLQENISQEWHDMTGDSFIVDVRTIQADNDETLFKSVCEVAKYSLKFNELTFEDQFHAFQVLAGRRLVFSFGSLFGIKIPDDLNDTIEDELALQPYIDLFYKYSGIQYHLSKTTDMGSIFKPPENVASTMEKNKKLFRKLNTRIPYTKKEMRAWIAQVDLPDRDFTVPF